MSALEEPEESDEEPTKKDFSLATIMKKVLIEDLRYNHTYFM